MDKVSITRLLLNQMESLSFEKDELWGFTRLTTEQTGLNYDIFVDDDKSYQSYHHNLWLYVECEKGVRIPITISRKPVVKKFISQNKYDLNEVTRFIKTNCNLLENLAKGQTTHEIFWEILRKIDGESINESKLLILEGK